MIEPRSWRRLKRWGKAAVPFIAPWIDGRPQFGKKDAGKLRRCGLQRVCNICGRKLDDVMVFVGGAIATRTLVFDEPPLHEECARAAFAACPYLREMVAGNVDGGSYLTFARSVKLQQRRGSIAFIAGSVLRVETVRPDPEAAIAEVLV